MRKLLKFCVVIRLRSANYQFRRSGIDAVDNESVSGRTGVGDGGQVLWKLAALLVTIGHNEIYARERRLFIELPDSGTAEIFATPGGRYFCPQLTFSPLGSPWLQFVNGGDGLTTKILADDYGSVELLRVD